ncbi:hypothetical protein [Minwuia sp.]|uniref:hypothetical protein n=1 Tax=Minwuia sp. TaxID=2493630 RepID=UPI003A940D59
MMQADNEIAKRPAPKIELGAEDRTPVLLPPRVGQVEVRDRVTVWGLVSRSWLIFLRHLDIFLMLMWRPFAVSVAAAYAAVEATPFIGAEIAATLFTLISMVVIIPVVTAWHRMILMGADNPRARIAYQVTRTEWSYLKAAAVLYGLGYIIGLAVNAIYGPLLGGPIIWLVREGFDPAGLLSNYGPAAVSWGSVAIILGFLVARFFLVLPSAAVGLPMGFSDSAVATRGNGVRLVLAYLLASIPAAALAAWFDTPVTVLTSARSADEMFLDLVLAIVPRILLYTIAVGILSLAFERLVGVPKRMLD